MLRLIWRQRRRLAFTWFFATLTFVTVLTGHDTFAENYARADPAWLWLMLLLGLCLALGLAAAALTALLILVLPGFRIWGEFISVYAFLMTVLFRLLPEALTADLWGLVWIWGVVIVLQLTMYGTALDRFRLRQPFVTRRFRAGETPDRLWSVLVPGAAPVAEHWDTLLVDVIPDPADPKQRKVRYRHGGSLFQEQTQTTLAEQAPAHYRYAWEGEVTEANRPLNRGLFDIALRAAGAGQTEVTLGRGVEAMLPRVALLRWFDDDLGDQADHLEARFRGRPDWSLTGRYRRQVAQSA